MLTHVDEIDVDMVYETFRTTPESELVMDGWQPRELSLFSLEVCRQIAVLFSLIGEPWPGSTVHARVTDLENLVPPSAKS